jgi:crotonobetainyl-CoA:carnitine CoA-transferase CaiB-like acyl-CoA transferase
VSDTSKPNHQRPPLDGVRILSAEQFGGGPWGTMMLADLGAEIIKIENPQTQGDIARQVPPMTGKQDSIYFQSFNRNKKSITLNLQHPRSQEILHPLVAESEGVFNNLRGDLPAKLGLDYTALGKVKPSIVCCSLSAFGRTGRRAREPGYDYLMQGYAGWMSLTGEPGGPPQKSGLSLVDYSSGVLAALGMVSAILRARETAIGCDVDVSLYDSALSHLSYVGAWYLSGGIEPQRTEDSSHPSQIPSQILPTRDGHLVIMCAKEKFYRRLVRIVGRPELADDPRFNSFPNRLKNRDELVAILKELFRRKSTADWLELLKCEVPCAPVNTVREAFADSQVAEDEMILEFPHAELGLVRTVAGPIRISDSKARHSSAPQLGEHTEEVLRSHLGKTPEEIQELRDEGVF